jgi:drug/metabolite transporter (DMT)-like permease
MQFPWYIGALGAALAWGVHYPLVEHALRRISVLSVLLLTGIPVVLVALAFYREVGHDVQVMRALPWLERLPILAIGLTSLVGSVLLFLAIDSKNATLASLIEISYPVFVAFFAFVLFRENTLNPSVALGALLVFAGVSIIIVNNP